MIRVPLKTVFRRAGITSGKAYSKIRDFEKKFSQFDKQFGGIPGDIYRASPLSLTYNQTIVPAKQFLKAGEKIFGSIAQEKTNKQKLSEGIIEGLLTVSGGTNDFIDRTLKSQTFNNLYRSPYIQNYLTT